MIVYPAIDLKGGACVRLEQGDMARATRFNDDPADQARRFAAAGASWIHVVDLDGAFAGRAVNEAAVRAIREAVACDIQLGGGIRDAAAIDRWLAAGVSRVVLGTIAARDPGFVAEQCRRHPGRIAVGIDARDGMVATDGWAKTSSIAAGDLARRMAEVGAAAIIHTDIARDGVLGGPNIAATLALARLARAPVIASGGVSSLADLRALRAHEIDGIAGAICGRALYDGRIDLAAAIAEMAG